MTKFIVDIDEEELSDATKKEIEEIIKELKPGTIKMIYQVIDGNQVEFYVRANRKGDIFMGKPVSYTHLTLPTTCNLCRSRWSPYH